jgi:nucleotide-binding universal stress UspA family protein
VVGVAGARLRALRRALRCYDVERLQEIVMDYLEERGFAAWWDDLHLVAPAREARKVAEALKELFEAAGVRVGLSFWPGDEPGTVKIEVDLPWGSPPSERPREGRESRMEDPAPGI